MPLNPKIRVSTGGIHGNCWFANQDIPKGEWLWKAGEWDTNAETLVPVEEVHKWSQEKQDRFLALAYMVNPTTYSGFPDGLEVPAEILQENYVNHCCDGNGWYESGELLVALKDIKSGEEIAYDYALTESDPEFLLNCRCGKAKCRGKITGLDYKKKELQDLYGNHFLPYINDLIKKDKN